MQNLEYPVLAPSIAVNGAHKAIDFYKAAFGAVELYRLLDPETGKIGHAEITIKGALLMLADEYPAFNKTPQTLNGTTARFCLKCDDVEAEFQHAVSAGAAVVRPLSTQFYGHHTGCLRDPFGHEWMLFQEVEKVSPEEMQRRWNHMAAQPEKKN